MDEWEAVRLVVDGIKECRDYNAPDLKIDVMVPSECKDDEIPWYLSVPIEELSLPIRLAIISSNPSNAPPQRNRISSVLI